jgi:hypothetical protein
MTTVVIVIRNSLIVTLATAFVPASFFSGKAYFDRVSVTKKEFYNVDNNKTLFQ